MLVGEDCSANRVVREGLAEKVTWSKDSKGVKE